MFFSPLFLLIFFFRICRPQGRQHTAYFLFPNMPPAGTAAHCLFPFSQYAARRDGSSVSVITVYLTFFI
jgi:hypothetical protein